MTSQPNQKEDQQNVSDLIDATVPDSATALVFGDRRVSHGEFRTRVARLAEELVDAGVGPEVAVGVQIERSVELLVAIHAVMTAGGHYVPLDATLPDERSRYMVETSGAELVLVTHDAATAAASRYTGLAEIVTVDCSAEVGSEPRPSRPSAIVGETAAYTLFTSGSTGRPKGVTVSHEAIANRLEWMRDWYALNADDVFLQKTPITFDVSVWELFLPISLGATLVIAEPGRHGDPAYVADLISRESVTVVHFVPSMLSTFVDVLGDRLGHLTSLRTLFTSGEALTMGVAAPVLEALPTLELQNLYGPTEAAVDVTAQRVRATDLSVPIGVPVPATQTYVLDPALALVPPGVPGELYLGGVQLARGYASRSDLTSERFVADPFGSPGSRLYRTGDLVKWNASGVIEYLGRTDFQVKLRGQRLELGEVESAIAAAPGVVHSAATVVDAPGGQQLVGYFAPDDLNLDAVVAAVGERLPEYMRPTAWVALAQMPLGSAGKVDRRALPAPEFDAAEYVAPATSDEAVVAKVFADLLGFDRASVTESFFDLGGTSLSAARIAARVSDELGVAVNVRDVFDAPSVRELVTTVADRSPAVVPVRRVDPRPAQIPLSFAQQRMWFINKLDPTTGMYNIPVVLRIGGDLDVAALRAAVGDVVGRHETLRTTFPDVDGKPFQLIHGADDIVDRLDWRYVGSRRDIEESVVTGFALAHEWPIRVRIWEAGPREYVLAVVMHHIASDGESFAPLVGDLIGAYLARAAGETPVFEPLDVQYADYAMWQHEVLGSPDDPDSVVGKQLAYWTEQLDGLPDVLDLPSDRPRPQVATGRGGTVDFVIQADVADGITRLAARHGVTTYMVVHAALAVVLSRLSGSDDLAIGSPFAGRGQRALDPLVGMFVNTVVLRSRVDATAEFADLLAAVRDTDLEAFAHADVPYEAVVEAVDPVRSEAFAPLTQVWLSVEHNAKVTAPVTAPGDLTVEPFDDRTAIAKVDLMFGVETADAGKPWTGSVTFATDLFDPATAATTAERLNRVLTAVVADADVLVGDIDILGVDEQKQIRHWSGVDSYRDYRAQVGTLADLLDHFPPGYQHRTAVIDGDRSIDYAELAARTNVLARRLVALGVGPDVAVAISTPRSLEMMIACHAVTTAGGHFVPIAIDAPADRARYIVETSGARVVLVAAHASNVADWADPATTRVVSVDASAPIVGDASTLRPEEHNGVLRMDNAMYTIFTSGSTGVPKGVTVTHRAAMAMLHADHRDHDFTADEVILAVLDFTFDPSVLDLFRPAISAGTLVLVGQGEQRDPWALRGYVEKHRVTSMMVVPSMLAVMLTELSDAELATMRTLRTIQVGGEALSPAIADQMHRVWPQSTLHNQYGPTETVIYSTIAEVGSGLHSVPIGRPTPHATAQILDSRLRPVPIGVPGELYLGGMQMARGYTSQTRLTAERFVPDPTGKPGARMYRTGDVVAWAADGQIEYFGRVDFQVKLRGQRIELGEIESVILAAPGVREVATVVADSQAGGQFLVAYVVTVDGVKEHELREFTSQRLLPFMRPSVWMLLDEMPVNAAGKVDRKRLPEPVFSDAEYVAPANEPEQMVAAVFSDILGLDQVSVVESFFDLGGTSLIAARLASRASAALGADIGIRDVFEASSVRQLVNAAAGRSPALPPVTAVVPRPASIPLSFAQQRMWFINRFEPDNPTYNLPTVMRLRGRLDVAALRAAFVDLAVRHEVLRTVFPAVDGVPQQKVETADQAATRIDWGVVSSMAEVEDALTTGFDLAADWPLRIRLWPVADDDHVLAIVVHHIAADGESLRPMISDLVAAYMARRSGMEPEFAPLDIQFADFAVWQRDVLGSPDDPNSIVGRQLEHWRTALAGIPDLLELPYDRPRPRVASGRGGAIDFTVPEAVAQRIGDVAAQTGATPFMVLNAALATFLGRLSATDDVTVVTPVAGRGREELEPLIGMFVNTLVMRTRVDLAESFGDLVVRTRSDALAAFENADVPFETVVDAVDPVRSEAFAPLAQVMLTLDPGAAAKDVEIPVGELVFSGMEQEAPPAQVDLTFMINTAPTGDWRCAVVYATDLFDPSTVSSMSSAFVSLLDGLSGNLDVAVGDVPMLDARQRAEIGALERGEDRYLPAEDLASALAVSVAAHAEREALVFRDRSVSYAELGARVSVLARELIAAGVGPDVAVAVCIPRSVELLVAIHGVIAAGGQYVPVDVAAPADRVEYMVETAGASVALVHAGVPVPEPVAGLTGVRVLTVDASDEVDVTVPPVGDGERRGSLLPSHAAYTIFTSGSTGRPKGVTLPHDAVVNRMRWGLEELPIDGDDLVVLKTPYTFDCSVAELFAPLMQGSRLLIAEPEGHLDPVYMADLIADSGATMVHFVPSMLSVFLELAGPERLARLDKVRILSTTGEALPPAVAAETRAAVPNAVLYNLYGPTEAAVEITYQRLDEVGDVVPIGVPVWNSTAYVLDGRLNPVAAGVPGELYVGGMQLARGYAARPDLTADRFLADPFGPAGSRMYRTGDLVRRGKTGELEYLGRTDFQVKLRGQRIELGEIEAAIAQAPGVVHVSVTVAAAPDGGEHLVAYVAGAPGEPVDLDAIKETIATPLPEYMRPTVWMPLDQIPLNSAGKLDRKALPAPEFTAGEYVEPATPGERAVAEAFAEVLGVERVGVTDSFFDLGGNSLSAMRLAARAGEALDAEVSVRDVFDAPSVRELVNTIRGAGRALPTITAADPRPRFIPLSFAQQRMWFINRLEPTSGMYNIPAVLRLTGDLSVDSLKQAVVDVVARHEVLRTTFPEHDGAPYQRIAPVADAEVDWQIVASEGDVQESVFAGFDLQHQFPLRVRLWQAAENEYVLAVVAHHIASDGESMAPLVNDLVIAYGARVAGQQPPFAPLDVQIADYAIWQRAVLGSSDDASSVIGKQLAYWRERLHGLPAVIELPTDRPRPAVATGRGAYVEFEVPADVAAQVAEVAHAAQTTRFITVHAALAVLLARMSGQDDIAVGTPVAGRGQRVLDPLVGMFVNMLTLRTGIRADSSFRDVIAETHASDIEAFSNADVPFEEVVDSLDIARSQSFAPLSQVWLSVDERSAEPAPQNGPLTVEAVGITDTPAKVDLHLQIGTTPDGAWHGGILYATDLYDEATVREIAERFVTVLRQATAEPELAVHDIGLGGTDALVPVSGGEAAEPVLLADLFRRAVSAAPDTVAVVDSTGASLTYAALDAVSNRLARWLIAKGVGTEKSVALAIGRSVDLAVAIWAVAKTGGAYVPVDPTYPAQRVQSMVEDSGAVLGLAVAASGTLPSAGFDWIRLDDDEVSAQVGAETANDLGRPSGLDAANLAYVIYTSGSTGRPKGVAVTHSGLANFAAQESLRLNAGEAPVVLGFASPSFDASVLEYLLSVTNAGTLAYRPDDAVGGVALEEFIRAHGVTHTFLTPSVLATVDPSRVPSLQSVAVGGEAVPQTLVERWAAATEVHDLYGPTETTIGITISAPMTAGAPVRLGPPIGGVDLLVLDDRLRPVPVGLPGELYAVGGALSRGYVDRPRLTAERFVANPFGSGRMYRTGDVVRWVRNGGDDLELEYYGRSDDQVKLRGLRIELGEIEAVLAEHPSVESAVVLGVGDDGSTGVSVATALAAYLVGGPSMVVSEVKAFAAQRLPAYMLPASLTVLDALPLTPVGKLDKRALPEPVIEPSEFVAADGPMERSIAAAFADVLDMSVDEVSATTSFFDLGGNSLAAARVVSHLRETIGAEIQLAWLFEDASVRGLAGRITAGGGVNAVLIPLRAEGGRAPLFCIHPAGGLAWFFGGLVPYLADRPIYGLQDPHVVAGEASFHDVPRLAERYVREIRAVQPEGPFHLLGWSIGGTLAYEMARQLTAAGQEVAYLGVMDASLRVDPDDAVEAAPAQGPDSVTDLLGSWRDLFDLDGDVRASSAEDVAEVVRQQIASMGLLADDQVERVMTSFATSGEMLEGYEPGRYGGDVQFFTATADKPDSDALVATWRDYIDGEVANHLVNTHHLGMADAESLAIIGPEVEAALERSKLD